MYNPYCVPTCRILHHGCSMYINILSMQSCMYTYSKLEPSIKACVFVLQLYEMVSTCVQHMHECYAGTTTYSNGSSFKYVPSPEGTYQPWWDEWYRYYETAISSRYILFHACFLSFLGGRAIHYKDALKETTSVQM